MSTQMSLSRMMDKMKHTHTPTPTHLYMYIYIHTHTHIYIYTSLDKLLWTLIKYDKTHNRNKIVYMRITYRTRAYVHPYYVHEIMYMHISDNSDY